MYFLWRLQDLKLNFNICVVGTTTSKSSCCWHPPLIHQSSIYKMFCCQCKFLYVPWSKQLGAKNCIKLHGIFAKTWFDYLKTGNMELFDNSLHNWYYSRSRNSKLQYQFLAKHLIWIYRETFHENYFFITFRLQKSFNQQVL